MIGIYNRLNVTLMMFVDVHDMMIFMIYHDLIEYLALS
jgi:hypothetical protein